MHVMETYLPGVNILHSGETTLQITRPAVMLRESQLLDVCDWFSANYEDINAIAYFIEFQGDMYEHLVCRIAESGHNDFVKRMAQKAIASAPPKQPRKPRKERIPRRIKTQVFEGDAYRCRGCGGFENLTVDHIIPESKGGTLDFDNLQTLCKSCNSKKGARIQ